MVRTEYTLSFDNAEESEEIVREFLLKNSDSLRLTEVHSINLGFFKINRDGGVKDEKFIETLDRIKPFFIKRITNNKKYNNIEQRKKAKFTHYFFKLSPKIKKMISQSTLFWNYAPLSHGLFYGFEDPTFYKKDIMIGCVITHEPIILLYLTPKEKLKLEKKGVFFD